jgi:uncharacterized protein YjbI with pentapeptide repeats
MNKIPIAALYCMLLSATVSDAVICNWQTGEPIFDTWSIVPGPGIQVLNRNLDNYNLDYAALDGFNLTGSTIGGCRLRYAHFMSSNLTGTTLAGDDLTSADLGGANLTNAYLGGGTVLTNTSLRGTNLTGANFEYVAYFDGADFTDAVIKGADFYYTVGFTKEQLYTTASYKNKDLGAINLGYAWIRNWDLHGQNLAGANFQRATMSNVNFTDAMVAGASFRDTTPYGFVKENLYSTASYKNGDLRGINLSWNNLPGMDLHGQNLRGALLGHTGLTGSNFRGANLTGADLQYTSLEGADFTGANLAGCNLTRVSTYVYGPKATDFTGANLTGANFTDADIYIAKFNLADLRGANMTNAGPGVRRNTIWAGGYTWISGSVQGLQLTNGEELSIRNYNMAITVANSWTMQQGTVLKMVLEGNWKSVMNANIAPDLGGTLNLSFAEGVDAATLIGTEFKLFNWNGRLVAGDHFDAIATDSWAAWDSSRLYTDGIVTLAAVPEPATLALLAVGGPVVRRVRRRVV